MNPWIFFVIFLTVQLHIFSTERQDMLCDLEFIERVFTAKYAPKEWKKNHLNWSLTDEMLGAKQALKDHSTLTTKDYQQILRTFFKSPSDYHVSIFFHSTEAAMLPFSIKSAENRYFVTEAHEMALELMHMLGLYEGQELIAKGCELLQLNGRPIAKVVADIKSQAMLHPQSDTAHSIANQLLTTRIGLAGHPMPEDRALIKFKTPQGEIYTATIAWLKAPEELFYKYPPSLVEGLSGRKWQPYKKMMAVPLILALKAAKENIQHVFWQQMGQVGGHLKTKNRQASELLLGNIVWQEEDPSPFKAYIYESPHLQQKIGYLRIENYFSSGKLRQVNNLIIKLASIINYMERHTSGLIIDQIDNGGGLVLYAYAIAALLTDRPLELPKHELALTHQEIMESLKESKAIKTLLEADTFTEKLLFGYPCDRSFLENTIKYHDFLIQEWNCGKTITSAFPLFGISTLQPHPLASYSKPILMLVNESDFSAADFIPAIMQDNKRATIFGANTAGAGGCVEECRYPNLFGIANFSYTSSFASRTSGPPIENLGVLPDIPYKISVKDLTNDNVAYKHSINKAMEELLRGSSN